MAAIEIRENMINNIYNEDCIPFMQKMAEEMVDVIVTSPPYNIGKKYGIYNDNKEKGDYLDLIVMTSWLQEVAVKSFSILKQDGSFFLNVGGRDPFSIVQRFKEIPFIGKEHFN